MIVGTRELEGRPHYVVPTVMLIVGPHRGSGGNVFYPAEELSRNVSDWNGRSVVVYHPQLNGRGVSAGDPEVTNRYKIGVLFNAHFDGKRLTAEAWIDRERVQMVDERVHDAIVNGRQLEVSTGLMLDTDPIKMVDGVPVARNYRPDHLAILPDEVGACSLAKGCGLQRNSIIRVECPSESPLQTPALF